VYGSRTFPQISTRVGYRYGFVGIDPGVAGYQKPFSYPRRLGSDGLMVGRREGIPVRISLVVIGGQSRNRGDSSAREKSIQISSMGKVSLHGIRPRNLGSCNNGVDTFLDAKMGWSVEKSDASPTVMPDVYRTQDDGIHLTKPATENSSLLGSELQFVDPDYSFANQIYGDDNHALNACAGGSHGSISSRTGNILGDCLANSYPTTRKKRYTVIIQCGRHHDTKIQQPIYPPSLA
jgi:hypothetical protein